MSHNKFQIYSFDINKIKECASVLIIGKRNTGKTCLIKHILSTTGWKDVTTVVAPTDRLNPSYSHLGFKVYHSIPSSLLDDVKTNTDQHKVVVFDDCVSIAAPHVCNELLLDAKKHNTTLILTSQTPIGFTQEIRDSFDYVFVFRESSEIGMRRIRENYASYFQNPEAFKKVFEATTEGRRMMVINMRKQGFNVFWYQYALDEDVTDDIDATYNAYVAHDADTLCEAELDTVCEAELDTVCETKPVTECQVVQEPECETKPVTECQVVQEPGVMPDAVNSSSCSLL